MQLFNGSEKNEQIDEFLLEKTCSNAIFPIVLGGSSHLVSGLEPQL